MAVLTQQKGHLIELGKLPISQNPSDTSLGPDWYKPKVGLRVGMGHVGVPTASWQLPSSCPAASSQVPGWSRDRGGRWGSLDSLDSGESTDTDGDTCKSRYSVQTWKRQVFAPQHWAPLTWCKLKQI
jgi:hypothetical protein